MKRISSSLLVAAGAALAGLMAQGPDAAAREPIRKQAPSSRDVQKQEVQKQDAHRTDVRKPPARKLPAQEPAPTTRRARRSAIRARPRHVFRLPHDLEITKIEGRLKRSSIADRWSFVVTGTNRGRKSIGQASIKCSFKHPYGSTGFSGTTAGSIASTANWSATVVGVSDKIIRLSPGSYDVTCEVEITQPTSARDWNKKNNSLATKIVKHLDESKFTIKDDASGGDCKALSSSSTWNASKKECRTSAAVYEHMRLEVRKGTTLRVRPSQLNLGTIDNWGTYAIGSWPEKHSSGFTVGGTLDNRGKVINNAGSTLVCLTNSYLKNTGQIRNYGAMDIDCKLTHDKGRIDNKGVISIEQGTKKSNGYYDRTINDGRFFTDLHTLIDNKGTITQGKYTSVVNRGTVDNFGGYTKLSGSFRNWGHFYNICSGYAVQPGPPGSMLPITVAEGNAVETKPCDSDGDGIADNVDQCPNDAEIVNGIMDNDGCPDAGNSYGPNN